MSKPFRKHTVSRYDIFRGKTLADRWYVYDTKEERYVGGSFSTLKDAKAWIAEKGE